MRCLLLGSFEIPIGVQRRLAASCSSISVSGLAVRCLQTKIAHGGRRLGQSTAYFCAQLLQDNRYASLLLKAALVQLQLDKANLDACAPVFQLTRTATTALSTRGTVCARCLTMK